VELELSYTRQCSGWLGGGKRYLDMADRGLARTGGSVDVVLVLLEPRRLWFSTTTKFLRARLCFYLASPLLHHAMVIFTFGVEVSIFTFLVFHQNFIRKTFRDLLVIYWMYLIAVE